MRKVSEKGKIYNILRNEDGFEKGRKVVSLDDNSTCPRCVYLDEYKEYNSSLDTLDYMDYRYTDIENLEPYVEENNEINKKENDENMNINLNNLLGEFGKVKSDELALTIDGNIAVKDNSGNYVRWDSDNKTLIDMMNLIIPDSNDYMYLMPTVTVEIGDIIKDGKSYYQVEEIKLDGIIAINMKTARGTLIKNKINIMLGNKFYTKVVSLMNGNNNNTMNGIDPMMLMLLSGDEKTNDLLPLFMMNNQNGLNNGINPIMFMLMNKKESNSDLLPLLIMNNQNGQGLNLFGNNLIQQNKKVNIEKEAEKKNDYLTKDDIQDIIDKSVEGSVKAISPALENLTTMISNMSNNKEN